MDTITYGDRVSWKGAYMHRRLFGTVLGVNSEFFHVRTNHGIIVRVHKSRITKECK